MVCSGNFQDWSLFFCFNTYPLYIGEARPLVDFLGRAPVHGIPWFLAYSKLFSYGLESPRTAWLDRTSLVKESMNNISFKMLFHCCFALYVVFEKSDASLILLAFELLHVLFGVSEKFFFLLIFHSWHFYKGYLGILRVACCGMVFSL